MFITHVTLSLHYHYTITTLSLSLHYHCTITTLSLHYHYTDSKVSINYETNASNFLEDENILNVYTQNVLVGLWKC